MSNPFSLYIDHQSIAPLVRLLENTVQTCKQQHEGDYEAYEIRMNLYQQFLSILHNLYLARNPQIKSEDALAKLEALPEALDEAQQTPHIEGLMAAIHPQTPQKKTRGLSNKSLKVEVQLIQWIKSCDKRIFQKKEIDAKYQELVGDPKRTISLKKIEEMVKNFNVPALIVRTRNKQDHFFGVDLNVSLSTVAKLEEESLNQSMWLDDDNQTIKNSICRAPQQIKEEFDSYEESQTQFESIEPKISASKFHAFVMAQQSCNSFLSE